MDPINASGLEYLYNGQLLDAFTHSLEGTFIGIWVWLVIIIVIDAIIFIKTRNSVLAATLNLIMVYLFASNLPINVFMYLIVPSSLALVGAVYFMFK